MTDDKLTRILGWASVGLGTPLLLAPAPSVTALGIGDGPQQRAAVAGVGARELVAAAGLLGWGSPPWLWARVAGDMMDLALLGQAIRGRAVTPRAFMTALRKDESLLRTAAATAAVMAVTGVDMYAAVTRSLGSKRRPGDTMVLTAAVTVTRSRNEVYARWRQMENLPDFMAHLDRVTTTGPQTSHWRAAAPLGKSVEWDARITDDIPGERLAWQSVDGSGIRNEGEVRFTPAPNEQDTELHATIRYSLPGGKLGKAFARYFGEEPHQQLDDDLRRFKQVLETGEVVRSEGAPGGKRARHEFPQHPARPLTDKEFAEARS
jgi:uncharacterized membrane protein